jgi:hypothetical protein
MVPLREFVDFSNNPQIDCSPRLVKLQLIQWKKIIFETESLIDDNIDNIISSES